LDGIAIQVIGYQLASRICLKMPRKRPPGNYKQQKERKI
jgi:hypothetical protein